MNGVEIESKHFKLIIIYRLIYHLSVIYLVVLSYHCEVENENEIILILVLSLFRSVFLFKLMMMWYIWCTSFDFNAWLLCISLKNMEDTINWSHRMPYSKMENSDVFTHIDAKKHICVQIFSFSMVSHIPCV